MEKDNRTSIIVQKITENDIENVAYAMMSAYSEEPWNESWTKEKAIIRVSSILRGYRALGLKAVLDGKIIGAIMGFVDPYWDSDDFFVSELFVVAEMKRKGIGTLLMCELESHLIEEHIDNLNLVSIDENVDFYKKCGMDKDRANLMHKNCKIIK